jgi:hypothetical protein
MKVHGLGPFFWVVASCFYNIGKKTTNNKVYTHPMNYSVKKRIKSQEKKRKGE